jgi:6-phosphogluconate dehydrogenase
VQKEICELSSAETLYEVGVVGLNVIGLNLALNAADHSISVACYDQDAVRVDTLRKLIASRNIGLAASPKQLLAWSRVPRAVILLISQASSMDAEIKNLLPHMAPGDIIIDGGASYFEDSERREKSLAEKQVLYLGVGISGGEQGARYGPGIMAGGSKIAYDRMLPVWEACAARIDGGKPCLAYLGTGSVGHYVKMVLDGVACGLMELIAETYDLMKRGLKLSNEDIDSIYRDWNMGIFRAYLLEVTANILAKEDSQSGQCLVDVILDVAKQRMTGIWTVMEALKLQVPVPTISTAVAMRSVSAAKQERMLASEILKRSNITFEGEREFFLKATRNALFAAMVTVYSQGMALLRAASRVYGYNLDLAEVAMVWRGGSTASAAVLEEIHSAYVSDPNLPNPILNRRIAKQVIACQNALRDVVRRSTKLGIPVPGMMAAVAYYDAYRSDLLPANLIQAQQDYLGMQTYSRTDVDGDFHTQWFPKI